MSFDLGKKLLPLPLSSVYVVLIQIEIKIESAQNGI
jgi:hypothetical protein